MPYTYGKIMIRAFGLVLLYVWYGFPFGAAARKYMNVFLLFSSSSSFNWRKENVYVCVWLREWVSVHYLLKYILDVVSTKKHTHDEWERTQSQPTSVKEWVRTGSNECDKWNWGLIMPLCTSSFVQTHIQNEKCTMFALSAVFLLKILIYLIFIFSAVTE